MLALRMLSGGIEFANKLFIAHLVGQDFTSRRKEIEYPGRETDPTHHVTAAPPDSNNNGLGGNEVLIMNTKNDERQTSFFAQPGILAGKYFIDLLNLLIKLKRPKIYWRNYFLRTRENKAKQFLDLISVYNQVVSA